MHLEGVNMNDIIEMEIIDTQAIVAQYDGNFEPWIRTCDGFLVVFAINQLDSLLKEINMNVSKIIKVKEGEDFAKIPIVFVGNKCDLEDHERVFTVAEINQFLTTLCTTRSNPNPNNNNNNKPFIETSAKTGTNIDEAFQILCKSTLLLLAQNSDQPQKKKKRLCVIC